MYLILLVLALLGRFTKMFTGIWLELVKMALLNLDF